MVKNSESYSVSVVFCKQLSFQVVQPNGIESCLFVVDLFQVHSIDRWRCNFQVFQSEVEFLFCPTGFLSRLLVIQEGHLVLSEGETTTIQ